MLADASGGTTRYALEIPARSLILTHSLDKQVPALKRLSQRGRPNSTVVFLVFPSDGGHGRTDDLPSGWPACGYATDAARIIRGPYALLRCGWGRPRPPSLPDG